LLLVDIDHFKAINDHYGHLAGDACLRRVADVLSKTLRRASDVVARYGGEEFAIILPHVEESNAAKVAEMICCEVLDLKIENENSSASEFVTLSIGGCTRYAADLKSAAEMIRAADGALYSAKQQGRNRVLLAG
jgi:diguanylate cyclase (GGDEF)-like protein